MSSSAAMDHGSAGSAAAAGAGVADPDPDPDAEVAASERRGPAGSSTDAPYGFEPAAAAQMAAESNVPGAWSPVPVPPPTYVGKAMAPARRTRVLDLTRPGQWTAAMEGEELDLSAIDDGPELDEILDRRRAVNDW